MRLHVQQGLGVLPQGLKPGLCFVAFAARLKPCPFTMPWVFSGFFEHILRNLCKSPLAVPRGLKPTLPFEALCRPATHPLGGFPGRALLQSSSTPSFSTGSKRHSSGQVGITLLWVLAFEIRIEREGEILCKSVAAQVV